MGAFVASEIFNSGNGIGVSRTPGWETGCFADSILQGHVIVYRTTAHAWLRTRSRIGMLSLRKPTAESIRPFLEAQATLPFTYLAGGATAGTPPVGYVVDRTRIKVGEGESAFHSAIAALQRWEQFRLGWVVRRDDDGLVHD